MAFLENHNGNYRIKFCYENRQNAYTVGDVPEDEARLTASKVKLILLPP